MKPKETQSLMTVNQKTEIERRSKLFTEGKLKTASWEEVKKWARTI